jgi:hypothetical protein
LGIEKGEALSLTIQPSHIAVLVPSVRRAADRLKQFNFQIGPEEIWDGEGTKEIYIEREKANSLLLMEPVKAGAYQRALEKRGPGLHHLAIDVLNLDSFIESLGGSGWLLHPISNKTIKQSQTAYLARPGFPALIEVQEQKELSQKSLFVDGILIPFEQNFLSLLDSIGLSAIVKPSLIGELSLAGRVIQLKDLFL